MQKKYKTRG